MTDYLSFSPEKALDQDSFFSGKNLTIGGFKIFQDDFGKGWKSPMTFVKLYFTWLNDTGKRETAIQKYFCGWGNNVEPSKDGLGLGAPRGATRAGIQKGSDFYEFVVSLASAGFPGKLSGPLSILLGTEFEAASKVIPTKRKASVDPDEAPPKAAFPIVVVANIVTLPKDNKKFKPLTDEQMEAVEEERSQRVAARKVATSQPDEEEETPAPKKKAVVADDDDEEETEEAESESEDEEEEEEEETGDPKAAAKTALLEALEKGSKMKLIPLTKAAFEAMSDVPKSVRTKAIDLIQDEDFLTSIKGISVKNGVVSRG